jgi:hypothetical protein
MKMAEGATNQKDRHLLKGGNARKQILPSSIQEHSLVRLLSNFGLQNCKRKYLCGLWSFVEAAIGNCFMTMSWNKGQRDLSSHVLCLERGFLL